jgi:hypothetical protein
MWGVFYWNKFKKYLIYYACIIYFYYLWIVIVNL